KTDCAAKGATAPVPGTVVREPIARFFTSQPLNWKMSWAVLLRTNDDIATTHILGNSWIARLATAPSATKSWKSTATSVCRHDVPWMRLVDWAILRSFKWVRQQHKCNAESD